MLSKIDDISEDIHTYAVEEHEWILLQRRASYRERPPTFPKRGTLVRRHSGGRQCQISIRDHKFHSRAAPMPHSPFLRLSNLRISRARENA